MVASLRMVFAFLFYLSLSHARAILCFFVGTVVSLAAKHCKDVLEARSARLLPRFWLGDISFMFVSL